MRKEDRESSPLHIFSSHFYTTLSEEGTGAVESWTARKNIDIFKKRFVFLPINKSLHWSLCVVVNPAYIRNGSGELDTGIEGKTEPFPCILFLDSLKAHRKDLVARHVRKWLNAEWKRLMAPLHGCVDPFSASTLPVYTPRSKFLSPPLLGGRNRGQPRRSHFVSTLSGQLLGLWCICLPLCLRTFHVTAQGADSCWPHQSR